MHDLVLGGSVGNRAVILFPTRADGATGTGKDRCNSGNDAFGRSVAKAAEKRGSRIRLSLPHTDAAKVAAR
jgi:hypothetical protein